MVKLARGPRRPSGPGRQEPVPLFPPGDLPVFGPPPANLRRPMPPPRGLGHLPGGFAPPMARPPPPPPPPPHHHMRPPMHHHLPPPHFPPVHRRPPPPPLRPLLQTPVLPPRPLPFMRGGGRAPGHMGRGPGGGPVKRLGKSVKKSKNKKNKSKDQKNDGEHYCEMCDRGWDTPEELTEHLASHITCGIDGCSFTAHPKMVAVHVKLQHHSGLFKKIVRTHDQADIDKWITERKRNYPTKENIHRKQSMETEMEERGERIHANNMNSDKNFDRKRKPQRNEKRKRKKPLMTKKILYFPIDESPANELSESHETSSSSDTDEDTSDKNAKPSEDKFSDDEWNASSPKKPETSVCSALSALVSSYGSCDSSLSEEETCNEKKETSNVPDLKTSPCVESRTEDDKNNEEMTIGDDAPDEIVGNKIEDNTPNIYISGNETRINNGCIKKKPERKLGDHKEKKNKPNPGKIKKNQTTCKNKYFNLLEKLLKNEIKHERNYILQCICYIVKNNFFDG